MVCLLRIHLNQLLNNLARWPLFREKNSHSIYTGIYLTDEKELFINCNPNFDTVFCMF